MISNPCNYFVNGSNKREFTYEGGTKLFHFSPKDCGLSNAREDNVIFFANNEDHAKDVLKRVWNFRLNCAEVYLSKTHNSPHEEEFNSKETELTLRVRGYLDALEEGKIKLTVAPRDQFYVVGWASNDTCFDR